MTERIRVGLVGPRGNWGTRAHIPSIRSLNSFELKAVCTSSMATAREAAEANNVPLAFDSPAEMAAHPDVDLVVVSVRVPYHYELVMAALNAGTSVYCEWPLAANLAEAESLTRTAAERGVRAFVGLQARSDPGVRQMQRLIRDGWVGDVLAVSLVGVSGDILKRPLSRMWMGDPSKGANTLTIHGGHNLDVLSYCAGDFVDVAATLSTQVQQWQAVEDGSLHETKSPDHIMLNGQLENGAVASFYAAASAIRGEGIRLEVFGREGNLVLKSGMSFNLGPSQLFGTRGGGQLEELGVPGADLPAGDGTPVTANLSRAYSRIAEAWQGNEDDLPDFGVALARHRLIAAIQRSSDEGLRVPVAEVTE